MKFYIRTGEAEQGPFSIDEINLKIEDGSLSIDSAIARRDGSEEYIPLRQVRGIGALPGGTKRPRVPAGEVPEGDATGGIIPYKNPKALIAYYLGIVGLFPVLGIFLSIPAIVLGILGLVERRRTPIIKGSVHAWIGIVLGVIATTYNGFIILLIALNLLFGPARS